MPTIQNLLFNKPTQNPSRPANESTGEGADFTEALKMARKDKSPKPDAADKPEPKKISKKSKSKDANAGDEEQTPLADETAPVKSKKGVETTDETEPATDEVEISEEAVDAVEGTETRKPADAAVTVGLPQVAAKVDPVADAAEDSVDPAKAEVLIAKPASEEKPEDESTEAFNDQNVDRPEAGEVEIDPKLAATNRVVEKPTVAAIGADVDRPAKPQAAEKDTDAKLTPDETNVVPDIASKIAAMESVEDRGDESSLTVGKIASPTHSDAGLGLLNPLSTMPVHAQNTNSPAQAPGLPPEIQFAAANHENIVTNLRTQLLPNGGTMHIRLDPPELGALQVTVQMRDGVMTASFQTSSDEATRLLSHSLGDLKTVLETQGVTIDKLHVQQAPRDQQASGDESQQQQNADQNAQQQEQQRKEMLQRMWRKIAGTGDPLDLIA